MEEQFQETRELFGPLISKPKLSDKLLNKPPFRFLHDIVTNVMKATDFAQGLYLEEELDSSNIKEKAAKIEFLTKIITCVSFCIGQEIDIRPAKIVAGLEPENTNLFLQHLARCATSNDIDVQAAVQRTLNGEAPGSARRSRGSSRGASRESKKNEAQAAEEAAREREKRERAAEEDQRRREEEERQRKEESEDETDAKPVDIPSFDRPPTRQSAGRRGGDDEGGLGDDNTDMAKETSDITSSIAECDGEIETTQRLVEPIISRPKMATKLLSKPPFRFLHDAITGILKETGFAQGLYSDTEMDSSNVKEKQSKIDFLTKIISCVGFQLNIELEARPAKIIAGLEAGDTNKFLQFLAVAATSGQDGADAVNRVISGESNVRPGSNTSAGGDNRSDAKAQEKEIERPRSRQRAPSPQQPVAKAPAKASHDILGAEEDNNRDVKGSKEEAEDEDEEEDEELQQRVARPTTARRRPPKLKENAREADKSATVQAAAPTGIMKDGDNEDSDEEDDEHPENDLSAAAKDDGEKHGKLVRNILEDQKQSEADAKDAANPDEEAKKEQGIRLGRRRKSIGANRGGFSASDISQLRTSIQRLCQATNPLGKCLEYVYEDMEAMNRELESWRMEYRKRCDVYEDEKKKSDEALLPLENQYIEMEELNKEQSQKIHSMKASIAKNDARIQQLLRMVVSS